MVPQTDDPFDFSSSLLNLEEDFYQQGYLQGVSDGVKAGRTEGRQLGLEKGFQKFVQSGRLHGRAIVWANRLPSKQGVRREYLQNQSQQSQQSQQPATETKEKEKEKDFLGSAVDDLNLTDKKEQKDELPPLPLLPNNTRLQKHITTLFALVETDTLAKENTDEAVNDFDDRLKRAQGKAKIVERMVGEVSLERKKATASSAVTSPGTGESSDTGAGTPTSGVDLGRVGNEV
ncbi:hypothetical protein QBC45DRAFT_412749 [Copromyces sp. CBS 386.78]|nr:hypothetical protein QBC45DRAFT_412749 [Copromyces sp. CBS 386.78]